jgi:Amiloride-sensitive sodium channel
VTNFNSSTIESHGKQFKYSQIAVYFKDHQIMTSQRSELYGKAAFLANCGGLMGMCLGVSVISAFEILYFFTLRFCCKAKVSNQIEVLMKEPHITRVTISRFARIVKGFTADYSKNTTIQGIKYITTTELSKFERGWWLIVILASIWCCGSLIYNVVTRFEQSPVIISFADEVTPLSDVKDFDAFQNSNQLRFLLLQIPFPALTVCPQTVSEITTDIYYDFKVDGLSLYDLNKKE